MAKPSSRLAPLLLGLCALGLISCGTTSSTQRMWEDSAWADPVACEDSRADRCVVLACDEGECGLFACEDVDAEGVARTPAASVVEPALGRPTFRAPGASRNWWQRRTGIRGGARPLVTSPAPQLRAVFVPVLPPETGRLIKHHLFPQQARLAAYFKAGGIDIHEFTMVIPEHIHRRIHSGSGMGPGGAWNAAWREFIKVNPRPPSREILMRHAIELAFRFELSGPIVPYNTPLVPRTPGPRIEAY